METNYINSYRLSGEVKWNSLDVTRLQLYSKMLWLHITFDGNDIMYRRCLVDLKNPGKDHQNHSIYRLDYELKIISLSTSAVHSHILYYPTTTSPGHKRNYIPVSKNGNFYWALENETSNFKNNGWNVLWNRVVFLSILRDHKIAYQVASGPQLVALSEISEDQEGGSWTTCDSHSLLTGGWGIPGE